VARWPALLLATLGVLVTAMVTGLATAWFTGLGPLESFLLGATVASTDAAAVFLLLRASGLTLQRRVGATLEIESGINDPMAVFLCLLTVELLLGRQPGAPWSLVARFALQIGGGAAIGVAAGGMSAGQLVMIPLASQLTDTLGWRASFLWLGLGLLALVLPIAAWLVRNTPEERGLRPFGASGPVRTAAQAHAAQQAGRVSVTEAAQTLPFWLLMGTFFVCGYTSAGMIGTHFIPHALEHNFTSMQASAALGVMGAMNILGTIGAGWLCDRVGRRGPLAIFYFLRGLSLLFLLYVWNVPSLHFWAALFGLNYISTVPPTTTLTANIYGRFSVGELSGWIFFARQVGAALAAALAGWVYESTGSYSPAFVSAAVLAFVATGMTLMIREEPIRARPLQPAAVTT